MSSVAQIMAELDDHGFEDTASSRKAALVNDTLQDVCSREPWPFLEKSIALTFGGISRTASNWPTDFSKVLTLVNPSASSQSNASVIGWERWDTIRKRFGDSQTLVQAPFTYYIQAGVVQPFPIPPAGTILNLDYIAHHTVVDETTAEASILLPARHHRVITLGALYKLYALEDDSELSQLFKSEYESRISRMREDLMRQQYDRADRIFMLDEDDLDFYRLY